MSEQFHHITVRLQPDDETPVAEGSDRLSVFLQTGFMLNTSRVVGPLNANEKRDESLGHIWHDVHPAKGKYAFELATELPYYLPNFRGQPEYSLRVGDVECFVCNRMIRAYWGKGLSAKENGQNYILVHRRGIGSLLVEQKYGGLHPLPMRTFFSCSFERDSATAEQAIKDHFIEWRNKVLELICTVVSYFRLVDHDNNKHLFPYPAVASYPVFWLAVVGADGKMGCEQFTGDIRTIANRPLGNISHEVAVSVTEKLASGELPPVHESALTAAFSLLYYGHYDQALIQACTACETLLSKALQAYLGSCGASNSQLDRSMEDVTFSQLLNLHLFSMCDFSSLPGHQVMLGRANWVRKRRNEIVHYGCSQQELNKAIVSEGIESIAGIMKYVESQCLGSEGTT